MLGLIVKGIGISRRLQEHHRHVNAVKKDIIWISMDFVRNNHLFVNKLMKKVIVKIVVKAIMSKAEFALKMIKIAKNTLGLIVKVNGINSGLKKDKKPANAVRKDFTQIFTIFV